MREEWQMFTSTSVMLWTLSPGIPSPQVSPGLRGWICLDVWYSYFFPFLRTADFLCSTKFLTVEAGLKCWHCKIMDCWAVTCLRFHFIIPHDLLFVLGKLYRWSITLLLPKGDTEEKVVVRNRTSPKLMFRLSPHACSGEQRGQCGWVCWSQCISRTSWFHAAGLTLTQTKSTVSGKHFSTENLWIKDLEQVPHGGKSKQQISPWCSNQLTAMLFSSMQRKKKIKK